VKGLKTFRSLKTLIHWTWNYKYAVDLQKQQHYDEKNNILPVASVGNYNKQLREFYFHAQSERKTL
jgi:hypothetical protein